METAMHRPHEEIWVDGPLSTSHHPNEVWIDGPHEIYCRSPKLRSQKSSTPKHRAKFMHTKSRTSHPLASPPDMMDESCNAFETESIVSSHCHLPVLPVFKDHSLLPFRPNQLVPKAKPAPVVAVEPPPINLKLSTNQLNDDLELLEKTLETLLVPSPIVPTSHDNESVMTQSLNRIEQLSSLMSNDEKSKRLSRIVSPTRFDKLLM